MRNSCGVASRRGRARARSRQAELDGQGPAHARRGRLVDGAQPCDLEAVMQQRDHRAELGPQFTRATLAALDAGTDDPIADAGRERVLERYTWDRLATRLADAWKSFT